MSFEQLQKAILEEADKKSQEVADGLYEQLVTEENRIKEKAQAIEEKIVEAGEIKGKEEAKRLHQEASLQMRALVLSAKQEELDKTKELFKEEILKGDNDNLSSLLKGLVKNIPEDKGTVVLGEKHADELKKLIKGSNISIEKKQLNNEGGFVYRNDTIELNFTISRLVDDLFIRHRSAIANTLFN